MPNEYENPIPSLENEISEAEIPTDVDQTTKRDNSVYRPVKKVYFAFIDALGFKHEFEKKHNINGENKFSKTFSYFNRIMSNPELPTSENLWQYGQTSDSLYFYTNRIDYLSNFIKLYTNFNLYAMYNDVFFRGGIATGNLFIDKPHQFYGDSVIRAYLLEDSIAKLPKVLIDESTSKDLKKEATVLELISDIEEPKRSFITPFVNISNGCLTAYTSMSQEELFIIDAKAKKKISKNIKKNLKDFEFNEKNYQKYAFLKEEYETLKDIEKI